MEEPWYMKVDREAGEHLAKLLELPDPEFDEAPGEGEFDPWEIFPCFYGSYSSDFDDAVLHVLHNLVAGSFDGEGLPHHMIREALCTAHLCDYGTSPRVCFPTGRFKEMLPRLIERWVDYTKRQWGDAA